MRKKRFKETISTGVVTDIVTGKEYNCEMRIDDKLLELLNQLNDENEQLKKDLKIIEEHRKQETEYTARLEEKNEQLRKELENNIASYKKCNRRVFDLIDNKINEVDTIGAEVLKDLRRELMRND